MTLEEIRREYDRLDSKLGINTKNIRLAFSKRMTRTYGVCSFRDGRPVEIRIAAFLLKEPEQMLDTVRHEYAHAAAFLTTGRRHGHDAVWKNLCRIVGCRPSRLAPACKAAQEKRSSLARYILICKGCGITTEYQRKGKVIKVLEAGGKLRCRLCGGTDFALQTRKQA